MSVTDTLRSYNCIYWLSLPSTRNKITNSTPKVTGTFTQITIPTGVAASFNGNTYITISDAQIAHNFTISFWFYQTESVATDGVRSLFITKSSTNISYILLSINDTNTLSVTLKSINNTGAKLDSSHVILNDGWYYITLVHSDSLTELYVNGNLRAGDYNKYNIDLTTHDIQMIGGISGQLFFKGYMKNFMFFDQCLTPDQIKRIHDQISPLGFTNHVY